MKKGAVSLVNWPFRQLVISSTWHFVNLSFRQPFHRPLKNSIIWDNLNHSPSPCKATFHPTIYLAFFPLVKTIMGRLTKWRVDEMTWHQKNENCIFGLTIEIFSVLSIWMWDRFDQNSCKNYEMLVMIRKCHEMIAMPWYAALVFTSGT